MNRINPSTDQHEFTPEVLEVLRQFRHLKPWRGTLAERREKFFKLHDALCLLHPTLTVGWALNLQNIPEPELEHGDGGLKPDGDKQIILVGKLSVVTYLFCFAMVVQNRNREQSIAWANALYKRIFRRSAARMHFYNGFVVKPSSNLN
jgi:hypothetical protein